VPSRSSYDKSDVIPTLPSAQSAGLLAAARYAGLIPLSNSTLVIQASTSPNIRVRPGLTWSPLPGLSGV
jgi:hypothetical protein